MAGPLRELVAATRELQGAYAHHAARLEERTRSLCFVAQQLRRLQGAYHKAASRVTKQFHDTQAEEARERDALLDAEARSLQLVDDALSRAEVARVKQQAKERQVQRDKQRRAVYAGPAPSGSKASSARTTKHSSAGRVRGSGRRGSAASVESAAHSSRQASGRVSNAHRRSAATSSATTTASTSTMARFTGTRQASARGRTTATSSASSSRTRTQSRAPQPRRRGSRGRSTRTPRLPQVDGFDHGSSGDDDDDDDDDDCDEQDLDGQGEKGVLRTFAHGSARLRENSRRMHEQHQQQHTGESGQQSRHRAQEDEAAAVKASTLAKQLAERHKLERILRAAVRTSHGHLSALGVTRNVARQKTAQPEASCAQQVLDVQAARLSFQQQLEDCHVLTPVPTAFDSTGGAAHDNEDEGDMEAVLVEDAVPALLDIYMDATQSAANGPAAPELGGIRVLLSRALERLGYDRENTATLLHEGDVSAYTADVEGAASVRVVTQESTRIAASAFTAGATTSRNPLTLHRPSWLPPARDVTAYLDTRTHNDDGEEEEAPLHGCAPQPQRRNNNCWWIDDDSIQNSESADALYAAYFAPCELASGIQEEPTTADTTSARAQAAIQSRIVTQLNAFHGAQLELLRSEVTHEQEAAASAALDQLLDMLTTLQANPSSNQQIIALLESLCAEACKTTGFVESMGQSIQTFWKMQGQDEAEADTT